jgi:hypothetical protein
MSFHNPLDDYLPPVGSANAKPNPVPLALVVKKGFVNCGKISAGIGVPPL